MKKLYNHLHTPMAEGIEVVARDEPGPGGAHHRYEITGYSLVTNPSIDNLLEQGPVTDIIFQNGTVPEVGLNGVTNEALLAIVADRLTSFRNGPFDCHENKMALTHLEHALSWLHRRTTDRLRRKVEGTHKA